MNDKRKNDFTMKQPYGFIFRMTVQKWVICLSLLVGHSSLSDAQTFTQRIQGKQNIATLTIHHSENIDELVNGESAPVVVQKQKTEKPAEKKKSERKDSNSKKEKTDNPVATIPTPTPNLEVTPDTTAKKATKSFRTTGYRVQVYAGGNSRKDRQTAERIGNEVRMLFPTEAVYVHFKSPRWLCRMGNYRTQEEAMHALQDVKKLGYSAATIVKGKITLQY